MIDLKTAPYFLSDRDLDWVESTLKSLDLAAKIGQLFCPLGTSTDHAGLDSLLSVCQPGGILFRPKPAAVIRDAISYLQDRSPVPMLVAANLEAGGSGIVAEGTLFGSQMQVAASGDSQNAYRLGLVAGREARAVGINWAFSPVVDLDLNFHNPITNTRTFGCDPETVIRMGKNYLRAMRECGIAVSVKHFPGDGVDERDQHLLSSVNNLSVAEWNATYGRVYLEMIAAGAATVMAGHILLPSWQKALRPEQPDDQWLPASLSPELLSGLLRRELGFNGLIVSDATTMTGFTMAMRREDAVPACIAAGCDMFLFNIGLASDFAAMLRGIERGVLSVERVDEAVTRILGLKASLKLRERKEDGSLVPAEATSQGNDRAQHQSWARRCAYQAITLVKDTQKLLPLDSGKHRRVLVYVLGDQEIAFSHTGTGATAPKFVGLLRSKGFEVTVFDPVSFDPAQLQKAPVEQLAAFDVLVYYANLGAASNQTVIRPNWITPYGTMTPKFIHEKPTLFVSVSSPYHLQDVPRIKTFINAYTPSDLVLEELVEKLVGNAPFEGVSPVDPYCGLWDAKL